MQLTLHTVQCTECSFRHDPEVHVVYEQLLLGLSELILQGFPTVPNSEK